MSNKKIDLVIIRNEKTGHEIPIQRKSWFSRNGQSYPGYRLLDDPSDSNDWVEVQTPEPTISDFKGPVEPTDPLIEEMKIEPPEQQPESAERPKSKRRRKTKQKPSGENSEDQ